MWCLATERFKVLRDGDKDLSFTGVLPGLRPDDEQQGPGSGRWPAGQP